MRNSRCHYFLSGCFLLLVFCGSLTAAYPQGPEPPALDSPYFPNRLYAFVWRNWNLVPVERLAAVLRTDADKVRQLAADMGCEKETAKFFGDRIVQTVIRRNWHLLNYDQLLVLLNWTAKELSDCLREHDFFWIKLGRLKPRCEPLIYKAPTDVERARAAWFAGIVGAARTKAKGLKTEERFAFLKAFEKPVPVPEKKPRHESLSIRYLYAYATVFGDALLNPELDPYPEGYLSRLAALGVNGVWMHVVLSKLAPGRLFPEEAANAAKRLAQLKVLVARAKRYGIGVYLYFNEPRAQDELFFKDHPGLRGVGENDLSALCSSTPEVKAYLREGTRHVFGAVPDLAGFFTITGSENLTHCYSHGAGDQCPRCKKRGAGRVVAEVNALLAQGAWEAQPKAEAIAWDWGWREPWVDTILANLPKRFRVMSVSEWWVPILAP